MDLSYLNLEILDDENLEIDSFLFKSNIEQDDGSAHLRLKFVNRYHQSIFIEVSYQEGKLALLPFTFERKIGQGGVSKDFARYLKNYKQGVTGSIDQYFTILDSKKDLKDVKKIEDERVKYQKEAEVLNSHRNYAAKRVTDHLIDQLICLNGFDKKYMENWSKYLDERLERKSKKMAQTIDIPHPLGKTAYTNTLLIWRCDEIDFVDIDTDSSENGTSKKEDPNKRFSIPYVYPTSAIFNSAAREFRDQEGSFFDR